MDLPALLPSGALSAASSGPSFPVVVVVVINLETGQCDLS